MQAVVTVGNKSGNLHLRGSAETEKTLAAFLAHDAIKNSYLFCAKNLELFSFDNGESDFTLMKWLNTFVVNLNLFYDNRTNIQLYPVWLPLPL